jgi:hypothetical protein
MSQQFLARLILYVHEVEKFMPFFRGVRGIFKSIPHVQLDVKGNLTLIFKSRYFAREALPCAYEPLHLIAHHHGDITDTLPPIEQKRFL